MQRSLWLGSGAAALVFAAAAIYGLRGTPEPRQLLPPAPQIAATPAPAPAGVAKPPTAAAAPNRTPSFDIVKIDPDGQAVIAGRAAPGDRVRVLDGDKPIGDQPGSRKCVDRAASIPI